MSTFSFDTNGMEARTLEYSNVEKSEGIDTLFGIEILINNQIRDIDDILANSGLTEFSSLGFVSRETELEELCANLHILGNYPRNLISELYDGYDLDYYNGVSECRSNLEAIELNEFGYTEGRERTVKMNPADKLSNLYYSVKDYYGDLNNVPLDTLMGLYRVTSDDEYKSEVEKQLRDRLRALHEANAVNCELDALFPYFDEEEAIEKYESENPEVIEKFNVWFETDKDNNLTEIDQMYIKYYVYTAPDEYRSIFLNNMDKVTIKTTALEKGAPHYTTGDGLYLRYQGDFMFCEVGSYIVLYHEFGHGSDDMGASVEISYINSKGEDDKLEAYGTMLYTQDVILPADAVLPPVGASVISTSSHSQQVNFTTEGAIIYDIYFNKSNPHSALAIANDWVVNAGYAGNAELVAEALYNRVDSSTLSFDDQKLYSAVVSDMQNGPMGTDYEAVTDIYGGESDNTLINQSGKDVWKHKSSYWSEENNPLNFRPGKELWAEWYSYIMTGDEVKINNTKEYLPTACQLMEGYAVELSKE